ncbi:efflux RND transporter permease subunit, partial [Rhizobium ruizarguesonis]
IKSTSRRSFGLAVAGVAFALATAGVSHAEDVRTVKIATAAESKPLSWGAIGVEPQGYEPDVLKAINAKLPQLHAEIPPSVNTVVMNDAAKPIRDAISDVKFTLLLTIG